MQYASNLRSQPRRKLLTACMQIQVLSEEPSCSSALALLADMYAARARVASRQQHAEVAGAAAAHAAALWQELVAADPVRRRFWQSCAAQLDADVAVTA